MPISGPDHRPPPPIYKPSVDPLPPPPPPPPPPPAHAFRSGASQDQDEEADIEDEHERLGDLRQEHLATRTTLRGRRNEIQPLQRELMETMGFAADRTRVFLSERQIDLPPEVVEAFSKINALREKLSILEASYEGIERRYTEEEIQYDREEGVLVDHLKVKIASLKIGSVIPTNNIDRPTTHYPLQVIHRTIKEIRSPADLEDEQVDKWLDDMISHSALQKAQQKAWDRSSTLSTEEYWTRFSRIRLVECATVNDSDSRNSPSLPQSGFLDAFSTSINAPELADISPTIHPVDLGEKSSADATETTVSSENQISDSAMNRLGSSCTTCTNCHVAYNEALSSPGVNVQETKCSTDHDTTQPQVSQTTTPEVLPSKRSSSSKRRHRFQHQPVLSRISSAPPMPYPRRKHSFRFDRYVRLIWPNYLSQKH